MTFEGETDCPNGLLTDPGGSGFSDCSISTDEQDPIGSPSFIKFDFDEAGIITETDTNDLFEGAVQGDEYSIDHTEYKEDNLEPFRGTWSYVPGDEDPAVQFWTAKSNDGFNLLWLTLEGENVINVAEAPENTKLPWETPGVLKGNGNKNNGNGNNEPKHKGCRTSPSTIPTSPNPLLLAARGCRIAGPGTDASPPPARETLEPAARDRNEKGAGAAPFFFAQDQDRETASGGMERGHALLRGGAIGWARTTARCRRCEPAPISAENRVSA